eukprot:CAMPEP_0117571666 /NCGR_PEP_ID=MMETSP0784-20121206/59884_1 /TAXON_ID=39447 /ORGANISM="" /LENGTH=118 /DNA_ID=CAMNT_0005369863 /DNA_START=24 /DNA_END=377 /DNA_ORIENTATION=+
MAAAHFVKALLAAACICQVSHAAATGTRVRVLPPATLQTLQALDTDGSGRIEQAEIIAFARNQGLEVDRVVADFRELDLDGNGELDLAELSGTLAGDSAEGHVEPAPLKQQQQQQQQQ